MTDLTVGKEGKLIFYFAMPLLLSNLLQQLYSFVDRIIVGQELGEEALTAIGASGPIIFGLISLIVGVAVGGMIIISQFYGAKDMVNLKKSIDTLYIFLFFSGIIISVLGIVFCDSILNWVKLSGDAYADAKTYLTIYLSGLIMFFGFNAVTAVLRGLGDSTTPLVFMAISTVLNIAFDLVFIKVFKWGVAGAAIGTILAQSIAFLSAVIYLNKHHAFLKFSIKDMHFDKIIFVKSLRISLPTGLQQTFVAVGMAALYSIVNKFQQPVPAAYTAAGSIDMFAVMPAMAFAQALSTFTGQNLGAGKVERVKSGLRSTFIMSSITCIVITSIVIFWGENILSLFLKNEAQMQEYLRIGKEYLIIVSSFYLVFNTMFIFNGVMRGAGDTLIPMFVTLFSLWIIRIPGAVILSKHIGEKGIWWAIPIAWFIGMCFAIIYYSTGRWKTKTIVRSMAKSTQ